MSVKLVFEGDSNTAGYGVVSGSRFSTLVTSTINALVTGGCTSDMQAVSGSFLTDPSAGSSHTASEAIDYPAQSAAVISAAGTGINGIVVVMAGTNDIDQGSIRVGGAVPATAQAYGQAMYDKLVAYCDTLLAAHLKVIVQTIIQGKAENVTGTAYSKQSVADAYNDLIRAKLRQERHCHVVSDIGADPYLHKTATDWTTCWQADNLHINAAGHARVTAIVVPAVLSILGPGPRT